MHTFVVTVRRVFRRAAGKAARLAISVLYACLLMGMSGFVDLANAVVSCTDVISPQASFRYNEALYNFKYSSVSGKTYAIALSGITGKTAAPDGFFAFSPDFNYETLYGGTDYTTLKYQLSTGKFGTARPVAITSEAVKQFIVDNYGGHLGADATLVDAWKNYGAGQPYTGINGSSLPYTSWGTPPDASIASPSAVAMNGQGVWTPVTSGTYTKQIVEFDGKLDCAIDMETPYVPPPPPPVDPEAETLTGISTSELACLADVNGDGEINGSNEAAECLVTDRGNLCPLGALDCDTNFQPPVCPTGSVLNTERDMCQADHISVSCPTGHTWDSSIDKCVATPTCPGGGLFNAATDRCEKVFAEVCPVGYTNAGGSLCVRPVVCAAGAYNQQTDRCESVPARCPDGFTLNATTGACEVPPVCLPGWSFNGVTDRCEKTPDNCPSGYVYDAVLNTCTTAAICGYGGILNGTSDKCELSATAVCGVGWTLNTSTNKCEKNPVCLSPGTYDAAQNTCLANLTSAPCPAGYTYSSTLGVCVAAPVCASGTYNVVSNRCEAAVTFSCPDPTYTYNSGTRRCEKAPVCPSGMTYSTSLDKCTLAIINSCPTGYTLNTTRNRCEKTPPVCAAGSSYNAATNKCEVVSDYAASVTYTCLSGGVLNGTECTATVFYGAPNIGVFGHTGHGFSTCFGYEPTTAFWFLPHSTTCTYFAYAGANNFPGARPVTSIYYDSSYDYVVRYYPAIAVEGGAYNTTGYLSPVSFPGSVPIYIGVEEDEDSFSFCGEDVNGDGFLPLSKVNSGCGLYGYAASSPGYYGQELASCSPGQVLEDGFSGYGCYAPGVYSATPVYSCPQGGTLDGTTCRTLVATNPTCPSGGAFDGIYDVCYLAYTPTCSQGIYDSTTGMCVIAPTCSNGALDPIADKCYQAASTGCPSGYTLSGSVCIKAPTCTTPGVYDAATDYCETSATFSCPAGYAYSASLGKCYVAANCDGGGLNTATDKCEIAFTYTCPATYIPVGSVCQSAPYCYTGGSYNAPNNLCSTSTPVCSEGSLDTSSDRCVLPLSCPLGQYNPSADACQNTGCLSYSCPAGFTQSGAYCVKAPVCDPGAVYNAGNDTCVKPVDNCPVGTSWVAASARCEKIPTDCPAGTAYDSTLKSCVSQPSCSSGTFDPDGGCLLVTTYPAVCPDGYTWDGSYCVSGTLKEGRICPQGGALDNATGLCANLSAETIVCPVGSAFSDVLNKCAVNPDCSGGVFDAALGLCAYTITPCSSPYSYNATLGQCSTIPVCSAGSVLNTSTDLCSMGGEELCNELKTSGPGCPDGYLVDAALGICYTAPVCGNGTYVSSLTRCEATVVQDCGTFSFDVGTQKCINPVLCPSATGPVEATALSYSNALDVCVQTPTHICASGLSWSTVPVNKCEAAPICAGAVYYDPAANACLGSAGCPYGDQYTCMPNAQGTYQCSPNECFNPAGTEGVELEPFSEEYFQDDGEKDAQGNCLGQIYIFNGKPSRCRTPGWTVGYINNCCEGGDLMPEDTGSGIGAVAGAYNLYQGATAAYWAYQGFGAAQQGVVALSEMTTAAHEIGGAALEGFTAGADAAINGVASGATQSGTALSSGLSAMGPGIAVYASGAVVAALGGDQDAQLGAQIAAYSSMIYAGLLTGPQAAVGIVIIAVMRVLMGTGCDANDIMTSNDVESKRCHYIGSYCEKKIFGACVQKAKGHCCFSSILSRIIHEQGRPQLTSFQPNGAWGPAKKPNCRGFTPEEFQSIDFSKIDLTEYYGTVLKDIEQKIQGAAENVTSAITNKFQQIQNNQTAPVSP